MGEKYWTRSIHTNSSWRWGSLRVQTILYHLFIVSFQNSSQPARCSLRICGTEMDNHRRKVIQIWERLHIRQYIISPGADIFLVTLFSWFWAYVTTFSATCGSLLHQEATGPRDHSSYFPCCKWINSQFCLSASCEAHQWESALMTLIALGGVRHKAGSA